MTKLFEHYLEAFRYCKDNNIDTSLIFRQDWKTWAVKFSKGRSK